MFLLAEPNPFPTVEDLCVHFARYETECFHDELFDYHDIEPPDTIIRSVAKRRCEYLAGRILAKGCLQEYGCYSTQVKSDDKRCPIWPPGLVGSISHTGKDAICVVGSKDNYAGIGVDIELMLTESTILDIKDSISSKPERQLLYQINLNNQKLFSLLFSAKEAIFKALYPQVLAFFDFSAVELFDCNLYHQRLVFTVQQDLCESARQGDYVEVHYCCDDVRVVTLCLVRTQAFSSNFSLS